MATRRAQHTPGSPSLRGGLSISPNRTAFSLVELVLVVAMIAVAAAIASPRLGNSSARARAQAAADRLVADFALARQYARSTAAACKVKFTGHTYTIESMTDPLRNTGSYTVDLSAHPYRVSLSLRDPDRNSTVAFDSRGIPDTDALLGVDAGSVTIRLYLDPNSGFLREATASEADSVRERATK